ncbi:hypothetical protein NUU61_001151 [Penicillium alfredii]|uniref:CFEM domain-containing protein n=1 Tax=Penicillium alfredii TaxID=1506179 RepID=A0A9W9GBA8_9EURO|nr:uncharacterized protein NUU61_001151 [Penicillium alfredii]KAJ5115392.1 hypothetical protein NUU61_001151 [Penicillium alfredii]
MLAFPVSRTLVTILLLVVFCVAAESNTSNDSSDSSLLKMIPKCAQQCMESFIKSEYGPAECTSPSNAKCLCRTRNPSGFTLGEAALSCILSECPEKTLEDTNAYNICDSVSGAIPRTHSTITATVFSAHPATTADTTTSSSKLVHTSESPSSTSTSTTSTTSPGLTTYRPSTSSTEAGPATTNTDQFSSESSTPQAEKTGDEHVISPAAVIGVSVSSGVAGSFIIAVAVIFCCKRWRRRHPRESDDDFEIGGAMSEPPGFSHPSSRHPTPEVQPSNSSSHAAGANQEMSQPTMGAFPSAAQFPPRFGPGPAHPSPRGPRDHERIGFAISSDSDWEASPGTQSSQHTLAELLPDQQAGLYPKPLKWSHRPVSGETLFEEDDSNPAAAQVPQSSTQRAGTPTMVAGLPANPRALKEGFPAEKFLRGGGNQNPRANLNQPFPGIQNGHWREGQGQISSRSATYGSSISNSSGAFHDSSDSSHHPPSSSTLLSAPLSTAQGHIHNGSSPRNSPQPQPPIPTPSSGTLGPATEVVSRPRIVRGNDIKRVEIRGSKRPPSEVVVPYCPEDFWLERGRAYAPPRSISAEPPYPSDTCPGVVLYPSSPKKRPEKPVPHRLSPMGRNLTPARRGDDLILRVE